MPKAEVGSVKYVANKMKSKGLQRLRWFCQACNKQCRDANGFKCHVQSETHVRQMQLVGEDPRKYIEQFSQEFKSAFVNQLRISHGEKFIGANKYYNEYIRDKEHVHMNATKWPSLTEFCKYLGREGICNVKEDEKDGLMIAWRDVSPEAVRRRNEIREAEMAEARNGAGEEKMMKRMVVRAKAEAEAKAKREDAKKVKEKSSESPPAEDKTESRSEGEAQAEGGEEKPTVPPPAPVKLSFGLKPKATPANKVGLGQMKTQSVFKRMRTETGDGKAVKKAKV
ncbi:domain of Kin17 curved DNA-binding protein-domain-containing protein [Clohesyomyces aquaticus]|uniref:Domain of Kin17 curved DNA-binding protein-domain-containing protein n=1 Tax=Clohesyomyces aquaticus TaxID=1231657 RepID=A0A1Y1Z8F2_9PLEO|nr:domain of Kin17 curved DNA-binding protein-domain-containing protein [Clohesyomyces aquaticus]